MSGEWARKCPQALVVSVVPDVCWTPVNGTMVAVPYMIVGRMATAIDTDPKHLICGDPTFTMKSRIPEVEGNEAGTGGGILSGVNEGYCRAIEHSTTSKSSGHWQVREGDLFAMNCAGPDGLANSFGRLVILNERAVAPSVGIASDSQSTVDPATGKTTTERFETTVNPDTGATTVMCERSILDPTTGHVQVDRVQVTTHPNGRRTYQADTGAFDTTMDAYMWKSSTGDLPADENVELGKVTLDDDGRLYLHEDDESYVPSKALDEHDDIPDDDPDVVNDPAVIAAQMEYAKTLADIESAQAGLAHEELKLAVDMIGIADPTPITDAIGAALALADGEWLDAGMSVVSMFPYAGDIIGKSVKGAKATYKSTKAAKALHELHLLLANWAAAIQQAKKQAKALKKRNAARPPGFAKPKNPGDGGFAPGPAKKGGDAAAPNAVKARKPHQPDAKKWTDNGGTIKENPDGTTTYRRKDGVEVTYDKDGYPDFTRHKHPDVKDVEIEFTGRYGSDRTRANAAAKLTETPIGWRWHHHQDGKTMQLIRSDVHEDFFHTGGMAGTRR